MEPSSFAVCRQTDYLGRYIASKGFKVVLKVADKVNIPHRPPPLSTACCVSPTDFLSLPPYLNVDGVDGCLLRAAHAQQDSGGSVTCSNVPAARVPNLEAIWPISQSPPHLPSPPPLLRTFTPAG